MKTPKNFIQDKILAPAYRFQQNYVSRSALYSTCNKISNFIFKKSDDIPLILLFFNSVSIVSSHLAQINGLKKSKRENKDYLITQEWQEFGLDLLFTVIPPFLLKNFLEKKFYSGQWTTKSARNHLLDTITPTIGAARDELYNTEHIRPLKESLGSITAQAINGIRKKVNVPAPIEKAFKFIEKNPNIRMPDPNKSIPMATMKEIAVDFDKVRQKKFKGFYNGSAYDEIIGQMEGMTIIATLAYTILASAIITPILKNKLANRAYAKRLKKMGETPESMKRKKRFEALDTYQPQESNVFDVFSNVDNSISKTALSVSSAFSDIENMKEKTELNPFKPSNTFRDFSPVASVLTI